MQRTTTKTFVIAMGLAVGFGAGCVSKITGNEGNFEFSYVADDDIRNFNKPIAVGARLDLDVDDVDRHDPVAILEATTDDEAVLKVDTFGGNRVTLLGMGDGSAEVSVRGTTTKAEELEDSVNMLSRVPEVMIMRHTCEGTNSAAYLVSSTVRIWFDMEMSNGQPVIGYGYYPVTIIPDTAMTLDTTTKSQQWFNIEAGTTTGPVTISSDIDSSTIDLEIVTKGDIDGATESAGGWGATQVLDTKSYYVLPTAGGKTICQAFVNKNVTTSTPTICEVNDFDEWRSAQDADEYGWFEVRGLAAGTCDIAVEYPDGNGGAGLTVPMSIDVVQ